MNLWIRSQDKEKIIQPVLINIERTKIIARTASVEWYEEIGTYKTKERAIEILDEIQNLIQPKMNFIVSQHIDFDRKEEGFIGYTTYKEEPKIEKISDAIIYQMPKE